MGAYNYITNTGVTIPDTAQIRADVVSEFQSIFGTDFNTDPTTLQGTMIDAEVSSRISAIQMVAQMANQINPNISGGIFLESIMALTGDQPYTALPTIATVVFSGTVGAPIPTGTSVFAGNVEFKTLTSVVIGEGGTVSVSVAAVIPGAVVIGVGEINSLGGSVPLGVDSVTNPTAGVTGRDGQSDGSARNSRKIKLGLQGRSLAENVKANIAAVPGVFSLSFLENYTDTAQTIEGVNLVAHSVWACVYGGDANDIAAAFHTAKGAGSAYNGAVTVPYLAPFSRQSINVQFDRPTVLNMLVVVTIAPLVSGISNPTELIQGAVVNYSRGEYQDEGFTVGSDVSPFEISAAIVSNVPGIFVTKVEVGLFDTTPTLSTDTFTVAVNQVASIAPGNVIVKGLEDA